MIRNYFISIIRGLLKHKQINAINILGLSLGITCFIFMFMYVSNELSYDTYHVKANRLYRIVSTYKEAEVEYSSTRTPAPLAGALKSEFSCIEEVTRLRTVDEAIVYVGQEDFKEKLILGADATIFNLFTFPFIEGNSKTALSEPNKVVITKSVAEKYFGNTDPLDKQIKVNTKNTVIPLTITGVIKDIPKNSHFDFQLLISNSTFENSVGPWENGFGITYFLLKEGTSVKNLELGLPRFIQKYIPKNIIDAFQNKYLIQKVTDIHLHSHCRKEIDKNGNLSSLYIFSTLAILILLITSINYVNLNTAKSESKLKGLSLRKAFGAGRWSHITHFVLEALMLCFISLVIALLLVKLLLPSFEHNFYDFDIHNVLSNNYYIVIGLVIFIIFISLFSGIYPAIHFSSYKLASLLKNKQDIKHEKINSRSILIVLQLGICIGVMMFNLVLYKQQAYIQNLTQQSFSTNNILIINNLRQLKQTVFPFKEELLKNRDIINASICNQLPCKNEIAHTTCFLKGKTNYITVRVLACDRDYLKTLNIKGIKEGRFFTGTFSNDSNSAVINEEFISQYGISNPIGKQVRVNGKDWIIIGVLKNFHYEPVYKELEPLCMILPSMQSYPPRYMALKINSQNVENTLKYIREKWKDYAKDIPFEYSFFDDDFAKTYESVTQIKKIAFVFIILVIVISSLGLYALVASITEKRTKEIGIRKVNGAKTGEIIKLIHTDFVLLVTLAFIFVSPLAWYAMQRWLQDFAYKTELSWWIFAAAGAIALVIALLTVSWHSWRAATRNPVESLRYE